ncbi:MAG: putative nucleic acid-binding Zn ribbon protein [Patiriisocius sp.]|jgi:predicted nucleic acid-binding Zn ribbon protein
MEDKHCLVCEEPIKGRRDKKFCSDQCRNEHHNIRNAEVNTYVYEINATLKKNRKILNDLNPKEKSKCKRDDLLKAGFNFDYFTNTYVTKAGKIYRFVYEQGYLDLEDGWYALVLRKEYVK